MMKPTRPKTLRENQRGKKFGRKSDELWKVQWSQITNSLNVSLHFSGSRAPIMLPPTTYNMWWGGEMTWKRDPTKTGTWRELAEILSWIWVLHGFVLSLYQIFFQHRWGWDESDHAQTLSGQVLMAAGVKCRNNNWNNVFSFHLITAHCSTGARAKYLTKS